MKKTLFTMCLVGMFFVGGAGLCSAETRYVWQGSPNPGTPYTSWDTAAHAIQTAVNASAAGDTVVVADGVYTDSLNGTMNSSQVIITQNDLTLRSENGADVTIIDGNFPNVTNRCVLVSGYRVTIDGFTLRNGMATNTAAPGAGLRMIQRGSLLNSVITNNHYTGGAFIDGTWNVGTGRVDKCVFAGNSNTNAVGDSGGGLRIKQGIVTDSVFVNNRAWRGGGAVCLYGILVDGAEVVMENCTFAGNTAAQLGGGLWLLDAAVRNTLIYSNRCDGIGGGGMYLQGSATKTKVENCSIVRNFAADNWRGAGVYVANGVTVNFLNTIIDLNDQGAYLRDGLGIHLQGTTSFVTLENCSLQRQTGDYATAYFSKNADCLYQVDNRFVDAAKGDFQLQPDSPCINHGINKTWMNTALDLDGNPRKDRFSNVVDIGAYEFAWAGITIVVR